MSLSEYQRQLFELGVQDGKRETRGERDAPNTEQVLKYIPIASQVYYSRGRMQGILEGYNEAGSVMPEGLEYVKSYLEQMKVFEEMSEKKSFNERNAAPQPLIEQKNVKTVGVHLASVPRKKIELQRKEKPVEIDFPRVNIEGGILKRLWMLTHDPLYKGTIHENIARNFSLVTGIGIPETNPDSPQKKPEVKPKEPAPKEKTPK